MKILYSAKRKEQRDLLAAYEQELPYEFIEYVYEDNLNEVNFIKRLSIINKIKILCRTRGIDAIWVFGEMDTEFVLLLSAGTSLNINTFCFQWAISFKKTGYDLLHKTVKNSNIQLTKTAFGRAKLQAKYWFYRLLGYDYRPAIYLGDGLSRYLVTMGPYWSQKFEAEGIPRDKIMTGFYPDIGNDQKQSAAQSILIILGAGDEIYKHSVQLDDWMAYLERCGLDKNKVVVRPHPKTSKKNYDKIIDAGLCVQSDKSLNEQIDDSVAVCLDRSTVMLRCIQLDKPIIFFENLPELFLDVKEMGFQQMDAQYGSYCYRAKDKEWLVGSHQRAVRTIKDILETNEDALSR